MIKSCLIYLKTRINVHMNKKHNYLLLILQFLLILNFKNL